MKRRAVPVTCLAVALAVAWAAAGSGAVAAPPPPPYQVVVNPGVGVTALSRKFVTDAFLKKTTRWPSGEVIHPVDQLGDADVRARFTDDVLKRSVAAVKSYWQQMIFSGRDVPPPELAGDEEVIKYVLRHDGAIGYVSGTARVGDARVVSVQ